MFFRFKLLFFSLLSLFLSLGHAEAAGVEEMDSIGVQRVGDKVFILHQVMEQETLFSISRRYKVGMGDIQQANELLKQGFKPGIVLLVPYGMSSIPADAPTTAAPAPVQLPKETPVAVVTTAPDVTNSPKTTTAATASTYLTHQVKSGESLFTIGKKYGVSPAELKTLNSLSTDILSVGQSLKISSDAAPAKVTSVEPVAAAAEPSTTPTAAPTASTTPTAVKSNLVSHKVKSGESLSTIAKKYGLTISQLKSLNSLASDRLTVGQSLQVSTSTSASAVVAGGTVTKTTTKTHKVKSGENLSTIAKKYGVTVAQLKNWNSFTNDRVRVGQTMKILSTTTTTTTPAASTASATTQKAEPTTPAGTTASATTQKVELTQEVPKEEVKKEVPKKEEPAKAEPTPSQASKEQPLAKKEALAKAEPTPSQATKEQPQAKKEEVVAPTANSTTPVVDGEWMIHTVKTSETLFSLATQYGIEVEELIQWNALSSNNLRAGQTIKVRRSSTPVPSPESAVAAAKPTPVAVPAGTETKQESPPPNTSGGFTNTKETGLAELIAGSESSKKYLVLHRSAPVGSVIRVKNEENDVTIFARVVGVLPDTGDNSKLLIKLSQAAYEQLKAMNPRFPVEVLY